MRLRNVKNKEEIINNSIYFIKNPKDYRNRWSSIFHNNNPIYIEIGMGKGKFIVENAIKNPNINFIGIEKYDSVLARALQRVPEGLSNLFMIRMDALEIDEVFFDEVDHIYLNFSDPWPKNRHHLRRLSSKVFLDKYDSIFRNNPIIEMRTDNENLFLYSLVSFSEHGYVFEKISLNYHRDDMPEITTEYEDRFSEEGIPIYYVLCNGKFVKKT